MKRKILITGAHGDIGISVYKILKKNFKNKFLIDGMDCKSNGPGSFFVKNFAHSLYYLMLHLKYRDVFLDLQIILT